MAGAASDRQLAVPRIDFAEATAADDAAIRRLLRENPMRGAVNLTLEREPDYFRGSNLLGGKDCTLLGFLDGELVSMGRCTERPCWLNGRETRVGYLAELRVAEKARGRTALIREGYRHLRTLQGARPAEVHFTSVAADNERARRLLERGLRGLPAYRHVGDLETVLVPVPRHPRPPRLPVEPGNRDEAASILKLVNECGRRRQLAACWNREGLCALESQGLPLERWQVLREGDRLLACAALWDQRGFRQTVVRSYSGAMVFLRPLIQAWSFIRGLPGLPEPGLPMAQAFLSPLCLAEDSEILLPDLVEAFFRMARAAGIDFITMVFPADDGKAAQLQRRFGARIWRSRLYQVAWPGDSTVLLGGALLPDAALL